MLTFLDKINLCLGPVALVFNFYCIFRGEYLFRSWALIIMIIPSVVIALIKLWG